jgi:hypothetical protein
MGEAYDGSGNARRALLKASQFEHPSLSLQGDMHLDPVFE